MGAAARYEMREARHVMRGREPVTRLPRPGRAASGAVFRRILVPLDLSRRNGRAIDMARELAQLNHARVTLLHVVQHIPDIAASELDAFYRRLERASVGKLRRIASRFPGLAIGVAVCIGEPAREIVRIAAARKIDLIVMGSHKVAPGSPSMGWGTTSYKVGIFCRCPILLVK